MNKVRITAAQVVGLLACLPYGKSLGISAGAIARLVHRDTWLGVMVAFLGAFALAWPLVSLARRFPGQRPAEYVPRLVGRAAGYLVLLPIGLLLLVAYLFSALTAELHLVDYLMPETPLLVFVVGTTLLCLYGAYQGLEVLARLSLLGLVMNLLVAILMVMGVIDHFSFSRLLPLFDHGFWPVVQASRIAWTDSLLPLVGLLFLWPQSTGVPARWLRLTWLGLLLGTLTVAVWPLFEIGSLGPEMTAQYLIACMQLARTAQLGIYLHRYEMVMMLLFGWGTLVQMITLLYLGLEVLRGLIPVRLSRGWFMLTATLLTLPLNYYMAVDRQRFDWLHSTLWPAVAIPVGLGLPLLLWLVSLVHRPAPAQATNA